MASKKVPVRVPTSTFTRLFEVDSEIDPDKSPQSSGEPESSTFTKRLDVASKIVPVESPRSSGKPKIPTFTKRSDVAGKISTILYNFMRGRITETAKKHAFAILKYMEGKKEVIITKDEYRLIKALSEAKTPEELDAKLQGVVIPRGVTFREKRPPPPRERDFSMDEFLASLNAPNQNINDVKESQLPPPPARDEVPRASQPAPSQENAGVAAISAANADVVPIPPVPIVVPEPAMQQFLKGVVTSAIDYHNASSANATTAQTDQMMPGGHHINRERVAAAAQLATQQILPAQEAKQQTQAAQLELSDEKSMVVQTPQPAATAAVADGATSRIDLIKAAAGISESKPSGIASSTQTDADKANTELQRNADLEREKALEKLRTQLNLAIATNSGERMNEVLRGLGIEDEGERRRLYQQFYDKQFLAGFNKLLTAEMAKLNYKWHPDLATENLRTISDKPDSGLIAQYAAPKRPGKPVLMLRKLEETAEAIKAAETCKRRLVLRGIEESKTLGGLPMLDPHVKAELHPPEPTYFNNPEKYRYASLAASPTGTLDLVNYTIM